MAAVMTPHPTKRKKRKGRKRKVRKVDGCPWPRKGNSPPGCYPSIPKAAQLYMSNSLGAFLAYFMALNTKSSEAIR